MLQQEKNNVTHDYSNIGFPKHNRPVPTKGNLVSIFIRIVHINTLRSHIHLKRFSLIFQLMLCVYLTMEMNTNKNSSLIWTSVSRCFLFVEQCKQYFLSYSCCSNSCHFSIFFALARDRRVPQKNLKYESLSKMCLE